MKKQIITLFLLFFSSLGYSQIGPNDDAVYLDSIKRPGNIENHNYFRIIKDYQLDKDLYEVLIYYKSGKIEMRGTTKDKYNLNFNGTCMHFFENGNRKKIATYFNNNLNGKQFEWYENGAVKSEKEIIIDENKKSEITRIIQYWDENNIQKVIDGEGEYVEEEEDENRTISKGIVKNYLKEGIWSGTSQIPKLNFVDQYINGKLISGISKDSLGLEHHYNEVLIKAIPKKGMENFYSFIANRLHVPYDLRRKISGKLYLNFIIASDGKIEDVKSIYKDEFGVSESAIKLIYSYKEWIPGNYRGVLIKTSFSLPITISQFP